MLLYVSYPSWLKPEIIPGLPVRWYGLMYLVAFVIAYLLFRRQLKERALTLDDDSVSSLFFWTIVGLLVGARIFATLVYDTSGIYLQKPWLIFWPFQNGVFVGLQGMSYHGGLIGALVGFVAYCRYRKWDPRELGDMLVAAAPLGYTFGRLGNFINGELYGRVTTGPLGMIFPQAEQFPYRLPWVKEIADALAIIPVNGYVNLPRHPSQLYEALFEGVILWVILWLLRNRRPFKGFLIGIYVIGYGVLRFFIEYFREPDADLGYRIELVKTGLPPALFSSFFNFSTGQILSFLMILGGGLWLFIASRLPNNKPGTVELAIPALVDQHQKNRAKRKYAERNLRKKLK